MKPIFNLFAGCMLLAPVFVWGQTVAGSKAQTPVNATAPEAQAQTAKPQTSVTTEKAQTPAAKQAVAPAEQGTKATAGQPVAGPSDAAVSAEQKELEKDLAQAAAGQDAPKEDFVAARETIEEDAVEQEEQPLVVYNPKSQRDPTLSPDDFLLIQYREQQRLAAIEAERQRKLEEERRKKEEAERLRRLELERIKDPTREVRNKIRIGGVIGQEVFIGSKIYTIGNTIYGARIIEVKPDEVVFSYKGHKFVRKVQL